MLRLGYAINLEQFYRLQLLKSETSDKYYTYTRWGRVGNFGQNATFGPYDTVDEAFGMFSRKFKEKTGIRWENRTDEPKPKKYTYIERSYSDDDEDCDPEQPTNPCSQNQSQTVTQPESKLPLKVQNLMELIFNEKTFNTTLEFLGYNADKLPLGKLGKNTLKIGFEHLQELAKLIGNPSRAQSEHGLSHQEVSLVN